MTQVNPTYEPAARCHAHKSMHNCDSMQSLITTHSAERHSGRLHIQAARTTNKTFNQHSIILPTLSTPITHSESAYLFSFTTLGVWPSTDSVHCSLFSTIGLPLSSLPTTFSVIVYTCFTL